MNALHSSRHVFGASAYSDNDLQGRLGNTDLAKQDVIHPMVIQHPISGKSVLYVNPGFTVGIDEMQRAAGNELLERLYAHVKQPQFEHRFSWKKGSVVFWITDQPGTVHSMIIRVSGG